jgi:hypothetical protein
MHRILLLERNISPVAIRLYALFLNTGGVVSQWRTIDEWPTNRNFFDGFTLA